MNPNHSNCEHRLVAADTTVITSTLPVPGLGQLPVNAFVIAAQKPVLVDAGLPAQADAFLDQLGQIIDLSDLEYIWMTHMDPDHTGALRRLLELAPDLKLVTTYLGMGKLGLTGPVDAGRVLLVNPGQSLDLGDRRLHALVPPSFDAPETTALFDDRTRNLLSSDCFGAVLPGSYESARGIPSEALREGLGTWTSIDAPWLHSSSDQALAEALRRLARLDPAVILSSHLPPAPGMMTTLFEQLRLARTRDAFLGPDQAAFERLLRAA